MHGSSGIAQQPLAVDMLYAMRDAMMYVTNAVRPLAMNVAISSCSGWLAHAWLPYLPMHVPMAGHVHVLNKHKKPKPLKFHPVAPCSAHLQS